MAKCLSNPNCNCPVCRKNTCTPSMPSTIEPEDFTGVVRALWDKIGGEFADKRSVFELLVEIQKLQDLKPVRHLLINQDRLDPDAQGNVELSFEDWIQADEVRANGSANEVRRVYNGSKNAVSALAVSELAKSIYKEIKSLNTFRIELACEVDGRGCPLVADPSHSVLYILCERGPKGNHFSEWLYIPVNGGQWERVGDKLDLSEVNKRIDELTECHKELNNRLTNHSTKLYELYKTQKAAIDKLSERLESSDFMLDLIQKMPRASLQLPGLMTPKHIQLLEQLRLDSGAPDVVRANVWLDATGAPGKASGIVRWSVLEGRNEMDESLYSVMASVKDQTIDLKDNPTVEFNETTEFTVRVIKDGETLVEQPLTVTYVDGEDIDTITNTDIDNIFNELNR